MHSKATLDQNTDKMWSLYIQVTLNLEIFIKMPFVRFQVRLSVRVNEY